MRHVPTLVSVFAALTAAGMLFRLPPRSIPVPACSYLVAQALFGLIAWWGLQRSHEASKGYLVFYSCAFLFVLLMALWSSWRFFWMHPAPVAVLLIVAGLLQAAAVSSCVYFYLLEDWNGQVPPACLLAVAQGAVLSICGLSASLATAAKLEPGMFAVCSSLAGFWSCLAFLSWGYALGITRARGIWINLNNFGPSFLAIVFFGWLAFQLSGIQQETSREPLPEVAALEAR